MSVLSWVLLALGLALGVLSVWERLGRGPNARAWTRSPTRGRINWAVGIQPAVGALLLGAGLAGAEGGLWLSFLVAVLVLPGLVAFVAFTLLLLDVPRWLMPRWYRPEFDRRFAGKDRKKGRA